MNTFREWLLIQEGASTPGAKQSLYPLSYGGIGLYTVPDYMNWAADAVTYMPSRNRYLKFNWGTGILSNPFDNDDLYSKIENKIAKQIEAGTLQANGDRFEKTKQFVRVISDPGKRQKEIASQHTLAMPITQNVDALNSARPSLKIIRNVASTAG